MAQQSPYTVATLGFDERERVMLRDTFRVSEHCAPMFRTLIKDARALPHIVIVNADHADAVSRWESFRRANEGKGKLSTLMWSTRPQTISSKYALGRPASLTQLFAMLEKIVTEEHGYQKSADAEVAQSLIALSHAEPAHESKLTKQTTIADLATAEPAPATPISVAATAPSPPGALADHIGTIVISDPNDPKPAAPTIAPETPPQAAPAAAASSAEEIAVIIEPPTAEAAPPTAPPEAAARPRAPTGPQSRFLVVDDSLPVRIQMKEALKSYAKTIDFAHSGEEALFLIDNCKYDVIFLDVILPGKDGYEVCRYIRNHALQRQTPVIMLTGNSSPADRVKGKLAGCDTYLIKPVRASVLSEIIGEFTKSSAVA
jgi:CheY-like chemotaxis protein